MSLQSECELLQSIPLFRDVDQSKRKLVAMSSERQVFQPGDVVFEQDAEADAVFFLLHGKVKITRQDEHSAIEIAELSDGSILGETGVLCGRKRTASAVAASEATMLKLDSNVFRELLEHVPQVTIGLVKELAHRIDTTNARLHQLSTAD